jgi:hypothetical protein
MEVYRYIFLLYYNRNVEESQVEKRALSLFPDKNRGTGGDALPFWVFHPEDKKAPSIHAQN